VPALGLAGSCGHPHLSYPRAVARDHLLLQQPCPCPPAAAPPEPVGPHAPCAAAGSKPTTGSKVESIRAVALQPAASEVEAASSDVSSWTLEALLEQSTNTRRAGRGRKEEGHTCHFTDLSHLIRLEVSSLIGSMCSRPNTDFIVCERQIQLRECAGGKTIFFRCPTD
jgi:hypothetical protein